VTKKTDLLIIGGGAAGLVAAGYAARRGLDVILLEKMERPGRKLMITGKGRCNLTNNCDRESFLAAVRRGSKFLYSASSAFSPQDVMALVEGLGVPLKTERGGRVFPVSDRSVDVVDALHSFAGSRARIMRTTADALFLDEGRMAGVATLDGRRLKADNVLVATGGKSYPLTGSTGDGYRLAESAGHTITPLRPSLIPIVTRESWCREAMGLSLKNVRLKVWRTGKKKPVFDELGEMLFTHFGISGPLVLSASAHMDGGMEAYTLAIDLKPALTPEQLDARILRDFGEFANRDFANSLGALLPRALIPIMIRLCGIEGSVKVNQITKEERRRLIQLMKALPLTPKAFRPLEEAVVTSGGVKTGEIDPRTMASRLVEGLYFAGEVMDVDAYTGGYNLQIAFCTAYLAAHSINGKGVTG